MKRGGKSLGNNDDDDDNNKLKRKTIEKDRRIRMKDLCLRLVSIIPSNHFKPAKEFLSQQDQMEQAAAYINLLRERLENLRKRKTRALMNAADGNVSNAVIMGGSNLPILRIRELSGSILEMVLICGLRKNFMLAQVISIIEQHGAEVVALSISNIDDKIFHTIHAQVRVSRVGVDTLRISERIQQLIS